MACLELFVVGATAAFNIFRSPVRLLLRSGVRPFYQRFASGTNYLEVNAYNYLGAGITTGAFTDALWVSDSYPAITGCAITQGTGSNGDYWLA